MITIKALYEMAKEQGYENAVIGIDIYSEEYKDDNGWELEYCNTIEKVKFGILCDTHTGDTICKAIWLQDEEVK